ncbi:MAG: M48 family metalloprotease [Rhodobacteraceae bacterium]|nr:M48 family metalloprotease [Paracoccaceae bacterium]
MASAPGAGGTVAKTVKHVASIVLLLLVCLALPVAFAVLLFGSAGGAVVLLVLTALILIFALMADRILHRVFGARMVLSSNAPELVMMTDRLAAQCGIPRPQVGLIDTAQANAFATCRNGRGTGAILLSRPMLHALTREEAEAVVALLIARMQRPETRAAQIAAVLGAMVTIILSGSLLRRPGGEDHPPGPLARALALITAPVAALLVRTIAGAPVSFAADRDAAAALGNPMALARALTRLDGLARATENGDTERHPATVHMFLVDPLHPSRLKPLFDFHPPVEARVSRLKRQAGVGDT